MSRELLEVTLDALLKQQSSITQAFPQFYDRVKAIARKGGVRLKELRPDGVWRFSCQSGTKQNVRYDVFVRFSGIGRAIEQAASDAQYWKKDKSGLNATALANDVIYNSDIQTYCECPADLYWAHQYTRSKSTFNAKYTLDITQAPSRNNVAQRGAFCKHTQLVIDVLPMYHSSVAKYLKDHYAKEMKAAEDVNRTAITGKEPEKKIIVPGEVKPKPGKRIITPTEEPEEEPEEKKPKEEPEKEPEEDEEEETEEEPEDEEEENKK